MTYGVPQWSHDVRVGQSCPEFYFPLPDGLPDGLRFNYSHTDTHALSLLNFILTIKNVVDNYANMQFIYLFYLFFFFSFFSPPLSFPSVPSKVIPLLDNGEDLDVTEMNKTRYLNILSQYRFTKRVGEEIDQFLKG